MATEEVIRSVARLPPLPSIRDILKLYNLRAMRQLSQNFLLDERISSRIVNCSGKIKGFEICEIGPGPGNITRSILNKGAEKMYLIEKDTRFLPCLQMLREAAIQPIEIIMGDVMSFNMKNLFSEHKRKSWDDNYPEIQIIGNLPFQLSTALIIKYLRQISARDSAWEYGRVRMTLTFQKEVAERIESPIMMINRCRLSIMCQNWCDIQYRMKISGQSFVPPPNVDVGVVHFKPRIKPIIDLPFPLVEKVVTSIFRYRQKYFEKGLRSLFPLHVNKEIVNEMLTNVHIDRRCRAFQLSLEEIRDICEAYKEIIEKHPQLASCKFNPNEKDWLSSERSSEERAEEWKTSLLEDQFY